MARGALEPHVKAVDIRGYAASRRGGGIANFRSDACDTLTDRQRSKAYDQIPVSPLAHPLPLAFGSSADHAGYRLQLAGKHGGS
jgi:hypothetical protein